MHQTDYVMSLLIEHEMLACVPKFIPLPELVKLRKNTCTSRVVPLAFQHIGGQLKYLTKTRWKIGLFSGTPQPLHAPTGKAHMQAAFLVLQCLRRYPSIGVWFPKGEDFRLFGIFICMLYMQVTLMKGSPPQELTSSWWVKPQSHGAKKNTEFLALDHRANPSIEPRSRQRAKQHVWGDLSVNLDFGTKNQQRSGVTIKAAIGSRKIPCSTIRPSILE